MRHKRQKYEKIKNEKPTQINYKSKVWRRRGERPGRVSLGGDKCGAFKRQITADSKTFLESEKPQNCPGCFQSFTAWIFQAVQVSPFIIITLNLNTIVCYTV